MTSAKRFEGHLMQQTGGIWTPSHMEQTHRKLQAAGLLTKGGHGVNAPAITPKEAATILLALIAERPADAVQAATDYSRTTNGGASLLDTVTKYLAAPLLCAEVETLSINRCWPAAELALTSGERISFEDPETKRFPAHTALIIRGSLLAALALSLRPIETGWKGIEDKQ